MEHASGTDPSPAEILAFTAEIRQTWSPDSSRDVIAHEQLAQQIIAQAVADIRDLNDGILAHGEFGGWDGRNDGARYTRQRAIALGRQAFRWFCDCDGRTDDYSVTFGELCALLDADPEIVRSQTMRLLRLQPETLRILVG